jgi:hypothetical protein
MMVLSIFLRCLYTGGTHVCLHVALIEQALIDETLQLLHICEQWNGGLYVCSKKDVLKWISQKLVAFKVI